MRHFRDKFLIQYGLGRAFVRLYYRISPPLAQILKRSKSLSRLVQTVLDGLVRLLTKKEKGDEN